MSLVGTPTAFDQTVVTNEAYNPPTQTQTQGKMSITNINATGIAAIRFDWPSPQENHGVGYSEIDVFGSATPWQQSQTAAQSANDSIRQTLRPFEIFPSLALGGKLDPLVPGRMPYRPWTAHEQAGLESKHSFLFVT